MSKNEVRKVGVRVTLEEHLYYLLMAMCEPEYENRSMSNLIETIILKYVHSIDPDYNQAPVTDRLRGLLEQAKKAADKARTSTHTKMESSSR